MTAIIILICYGLPVISLELANAVTDTSFWFIKITAHDAWTSLVKRSPNDLSVFDVVQSVLAVAMTVVVVRLLARHFGFNLRTFIRFGNFHWVFIPLVLCSPFMMAIPHFIARLLFSLPLPSEAVNGHSPALSVIFFLAVLVPIQEEVIWRGLGITALERNGVEAKATLYFISLAFMLAHLPSDIGILRPLALAPAALALTWMRLRSGGIFWPLLFHAIGNGVLSVGPFSSAVYKFIFGS